MFCAHSVTDCLIVIKKLVQFLVFYLLAANVIIILFSLLALWLFSRCSGTLGSDSIPSVAPKVNCCGLEPGAHILFCFRYFNCGRSRRLHWRNLNPLTTSAIELAWEKLRTGVQSLTSREPRLQDTALESYAFVIYDLVISDLRALYKRGVSQPTL